MWFYKIIGILLIIVSSTFLGVDKANKYSRRAAYLEKMKLYVNIVSNEVSVTLTPLPKIFKKIGDTHKDCVSDIFREVYEKYARSKGVPLQNIWKEFVLDKKNIFFADDIELLSDFSDCVASIDADSQGKIIESYISRLNEHIDVAHNEKEKSSKLYKTLGIYIGVLVSILLV